MVAVETATRIATVTVTVTVNVIASVIASATTQRGSKEERCALRHSFLVPLCSRSFEFHATCKTAYLFAFLCIHILNSLYSIPHFNICATNRIDGDFGSLMGFCLLGAVAPERIVV